MKSWLQDNDIYLYSTHSEAKSVVGERYIKILKKQNLLMHDFSIKECVYW